jgi:DNA polymerase elongation subunit (family B)
VLTDSEPVNKAHRIRSSMPRRIMGVLSKFVVESVRDERQLLLTLASIVRRKDPDMLVSWDTQGAGLGYLVERGVALGKGNYPTSMSSDPGAGNFQKEIDMARLLSRIPTTAKSEHNSTIAKTLFNVEAKFNRRVKRHLKNHETKQKLIRNGVEVDLAAIGMTDLAAIGMTELVQELRRHPL